MNKTFTFALLVVFLALAPRLSAGETARPVLVDVVHARSEITILRTANDSMEQDSADKNVLLEKLDTEISLRENTISEINSHLAALKKNAGELHSLMIVSVDTRSRSRLLDELENNRVQTYELERRKEGLLAENNTARQSRYTAQRRITANTVNLRKNSERIAWFESCIGYSEAQVPEVDSLVNDSQALNANVQRFLSQG